MYFSKYNLNINKKEKNHENVLNWGVFFKIQFKYKQKKKKKEKNCYKKKFLR